MFSVWKYATKSIQGYCSNLVGDKLYSSCLLDIIAVADGFSQRSIYDQNWFNMFIPVQNQQCKSESQFTY